MLHINVSRFLTWPFRPLWRHSLADRGTARWQFQASKFSGYCQLEWEWYFQMTWKSTSAKLLNDGDVFKVITPRESTYINFSREVHCCHQVGPAGSRCGIRWREEVGNWCIWQYGGTDCWWVFISQVWSVQFLEVNVKSIEIADMMCNYIIFRFKLQYIH